MKGDAHLADDLIPESEFARRVRRDRSTLWKFRGRGLPHYRVGGGIFYTLADYDEFLRKCRVVERRPSKAKAPSRREGGGARS